MIRISRWIYSALTGLKMRLAARTISFFDRAVYFSFFFFRFLFDVTGYYHAVNSV